jgi:hypothetical protein
MKDGNQGSADENDEDYIHLSKLIALFESNGYITKEIGINDKLHIVLAVPIR